LALTGQSGVGKSTCLELLRGLLDGFVCSVSGRQTQAGLAQQLADRSCGLIIDEFEAGELGRSGRDVLELLRIAYSLQEEEQGLLRGTPDGKPREYRCFSACLAAGISPPSFEPADVTRWVTL